jgi:hypothetical protein
MRSSMTMLGAIVGVTPMKGISDFWAKRPPSRAWRSVWRNRVLVRGIGRGFGSVLILLPPSRCRGILLFLWR